MMSPEDAAGSGRASEDHMDGLTPEEAQRIIHSHRKVRYGTACWPCRQRKVKCDNKEPCENCVKRDHAQLCSYKPNRNANPKLSSLDATSRGKKRPLSPDAVKGGDGSEAGEARLSPKAIRTYDEAEDPEVSRYVGQNSIPALLRDQPSPESGRRPGDVDNIRHDMQSILGLDNSAPFPLMSSAHIDRLNADILTHLPSDREVMQLFHTYRDIPQPFWGFIIDIEDLESRLMTYLEDRARHISAPQQQQQSSGRPVPSSWLAVLFAVLSVGSQYHDSPYHIRTINSQKYLQISFHFLRSSNFLLRPNFDCLQALLMTSFVLLNDMQAEASWALLGLTCRLAFSLGIHKTSPTAVTAPGIQVQDVVRRKLWWCCVWHDTLTSLSFDRYPMTNVPSCPIPHSPHAETEGWTYLEAMYELNATIARRLGPDTMAGATYLQIRKTCKEVELIRERSAVNIRNRESCRTAVDRLQYYATRLHTAFVMSVACRPALRQHNIYLSPHERQTLVATCRQHLTETVRMFLAMHKLSVLPTRSWAFTYHGLSSALLLGLLSESKFDPETRQLQGDLISALSVTTAKDQNSSAPHILKTDKDIALAGPLSRALMALKNIYDHGSVAGPNLKMESGTSTGTRTPMSISQLTNQTSDAPDLPRLPLTGLSPHQDAALAMTELQGRGVPAADQSSLATFPPMSGMPNLAVDDLSNLNLSATAQPMELFESIFWQSPDVWNPGLDTMNFDFLAQPPPEQPQPQQFYF